VVKKKAEFAISELKANASNIHSLSFQEMMKELRDECPSSRFKKIIDVLQSIIF